MRLSILNFSSFITITLNITGSESPSCQDIYKNTFKCNTKKEYCIKPSSDVLVTTEVLQDEKSEVKGNADSFMFYLTAQILGREH